MINIHVCIIEMHSFDPFSAGTDFRRQNQTSDSKVDPITERIKKKYDAHRPIDIQVS